MSTTSIEEMLAYGWIHYEHEHFKPGVRVRNCGQQYPEARQFGTAEVVAVMRKEGAWEKEYGRKNLEVLTRRDEDGRLGWWQDYRTALTEGCWICHGDGCDRCTATPDPRAAVARAQLKEDAS